MIERKSIAWPPDYIHRDQLEHEFAKLIWAKTQGLYCDAVYELSFDDRKFDILGLNEPLKVGEQIAENIRRLDCRNLPFQLASSIKWTFRKVGFDAVESDTKGIIVIHREPEFMTLEDTDCTAAQEGTRSEMNRQIQAAAEKFAIYSHCRRLVLLDFYGTALCESDIPPLLEGLSIPPVIDEVWRTTQL